MRMTWLIVRLTGAAMVLATAPLLCELLLLSAAACCRPLARQRRGSSFARVQQLVILVPSHNEEASIGRCVDSLRASAGDAATILVIAHNCVDATAQRAAAGGAKVLVLDDPARRGKGHALTAGFAAALTAYGADAVMVIDADSTVSAGLVDEVRSALARSQGVQCRYESQAASVRPARARLRALAFRCMNVVRPLGRHRLGLSSGIFGNGFALRADVLERVPYSAFSVVEDLEFHLALVTAGIATEFLPSARVLAAVPEGATGEQVQSARWEGGRFCMLRTRGPALVLEVLRGRLTLLEPLLDLLSLPLGFAAFLLCMIALLPSGVFRMYALWGALVMSLHLAIGLALGPDPMAELRALSGVPFYILRKISLLPRTLRTSRNQADWVRTTRAPWTRGAERG